MNPRRLLLFLLLAPLLPAASIKHRHETLTPNSRPDAVERAIAESLQDLLDDATTFFESEGPRSVRVILRAPVADGKVTSGTVSRSALTTAAAKLQEQASATLADLSAVMRGAQE
jgi:hypothetical protein